MERIDPKYIALLRAGKVRLVGLVAYNVTKDEKFNFGEGRSPDKTTITIFDDIAKAQEFCDSFEKLYRGKKDKNEAHIEFFKVYFWIDKEELPDEIHPIGTELQIADDEIEEFDFLKPYYGFKIYAEE